MPITNTIQGQDAIIALFKDDWIPFVCGSNVSIEITCTKVAVRTRGDGHWKKYTYQDAEFSITLSGVLVFDDENWTGWDMLDQQLNFTHVLARISFDDPNGDIRTVQGYVMIEQSTLSWAAGDVVKDDFQIQGNGKLDMFDGLVPCGTVITGITVDGQEASDGIVHTTYTYTGDAYQIKYRIDNTGDYVYVVADLTIDIAGLAIGDHSIEIIPCCANGYEGTGATQSFTVTQAQTCNTVISAITIDSGVTNATAVYTGSATQMRYRIDGGAWNVVPITQVIGTGSLPVGAHTIDMVPICSNGILGTGAEQGFTIASQPSQSDVNWEYITLDDVGTSFRLYINGVLVISPHIDGGSGTITVPVGQTIKAVITSSESIHTIHLEVADTTTSTILYSQSAADPNTIQYSWTANGDTYSVTATVTS